MFFRNGPEYEARLKKPFAPPNVTLKEIYDAVPKHLLQKNEKKATLYITRDIVLASLLYKFAYSITPLAQSDFGGYITTGWQKLLLKACMWMFYWWFQGLVGAGIFCLGHDAGHTSLYKSKKINNTVGFILHSVGATFGHRRIKLIHRFAVPAHPLLLMACDSSCAPYNGPEITKAVKSVLKDHYNYDSTPSFYALYRSFTQCLFIEDEGDIIFYKNREGVAARQLQEDAVQEIKAQVGDPAEQDKLEEESPKSS
ncbi:hypothetical protein CPC08DRAFT_731456 [Agrocybe pediades]|nr:hypothetical protein CPC08DRAFT_731456 [Agrocybe pediades]